MVRDCYQHARRLSQELHRRIGRDSFFGNGIDRRDLSAVGAMNFPEFVKINEHLVTCLARDFFPLFILLLFVETPRFGNGLAAKWLPAEVTRDLIDSAN